MGIMQVHDPIISGNIMGALYKIGTMYLLNEWVQII